VRFSQLDGLIAVVDHGSIRAAARALGVSQPALTKSLKLLERDLGAELLRRSIAGAEPTDFGRAFLVRARSIQADLRRAREEIGQLQGERFGRISLGASAAPALELVPQAIGRLRERYPGVFVRLLELLHPASTQALRDGTIDLAIGPRPRAKAGTDDDVNVVPLYRNQLVIAVRRGHALAAARSLRELAGAAWLRAGTPEGPARVVDEAFAEAGLPAPEYRMQCESALALAGLAATSDLVAVLPHQLLDRLGPDGALVRVAIREAIRPVEIAIFTLARTPPTPAAKALIAILVQLARRVRT
jgi:DNA-binding transcriptional LysR family regulator